MLKSTPIVALTSLMGGFLTGVGEARVVESACIKSTPLFGQKENLPYGRMDGDMNDIAEMSLLSLAYSRPSNLLICADEKRVHGMRFTLKMHMSEENDYAKYGENLQVELKKLNKYVDEASSAYAPYHMKMVGSYTTPCTKIDIEDGDKIMYIDGVADEEKLRGVTVHLASGVQKSFGTVEVTGSMREERHDFADKIDLLGLNAYVATGADGDENYIVALGFIQNECPSRDALDYEKNFVSPNKQEQNEKARDRRIQSDKGIAIVILSIIVGFMGIFSIYCCLKNRGQLCKSKDQS